MTLGVVLQLGGSLVAILMLAGLARWLELGREARIADQNHAFRIASESLYSFVPFDAAIDRAGYAALIRDADHRHALVRAHGGHFVARLLKAPITGRLDHGFLTIDPQEPGLAPVTLNLGAAAQYWASGLRHIPHG